MAANVFSKTFQAFGFGMYFELLNETYSFFIQIQTIYDYTNDLD